MKLEKKLSKYAIKNLPMIMIGCYVLGYILAFIDKQNIILNMICLNPYRIMHGQVWRLVSWILIPPSSFGLFTIIMLMFYFSIGRTLDQVWGSFKFNVYIFSGMLFTILGSFVLMGLLYAFPSLMAFPESMDLSLQLCGVRYFSTFYINMSIFLAFAATFPDNMVLFMFFIPIKIKWLGIAYGILLVFQAITGTAYDRVVIIASLLNFVLFFFLYRKSMNQSVSDRIKAAKRKHEFERKMEEARNNVSFGNNAGVSKHRCAICGRTELDNPDLQFRFCSKCNGNYEYCNDHLFNHKHVE